MKLRLPAREPATSILSSLINALVAKLQDNPDDPILLAKLEGVKEAQTELFKAEAEYYRQLQAIMREI